MDVLTLALLLVMSFALAIAGARSLLGLVLRLMTQETGGVALGEPGPTS